MSRWFPYLLKGNQVFDKSRKNGHYWLLFFFFWVCCCCWCCLCMFWCCFCRRCISYLFFVVFVDVVFGCPLHVFVVGAPQRSKAQISLRKNQKRPFRRFVVLLFACCGVMLLLFFAFLFFYCWRLECRSLLLWSSCHSPTERFAKENSEKTKRCSIGNLMIGWNRRMPVRKKPAT